VHAFRIGGPQSVVVSARVSAVTDWPSIAVLPFVTSGGDTAQDYLIDGVVEEVITSLSHFRWLKVIARSATFTLKGKPVDLRRVAEEFGVRYMLTGTARSSGSRVRVTAELVDVPTATQLWSERFEGEAIDVFDLQDKIAERVIAHLQPRLVDAEVARARRKPTESISRSGDGHGESGGAAAAAQGDRARPEFRAGAGAGVDVPHGRARSRLVRPRRDAHRRRRAAGARGHRRRSG
jgi:TolB-like protein